ncbi:hypothetical protein HPB47_002316 [Ixodes persulcatus]|uniref:Uncharacterized protein n=1 Tax=Ixodes persulcatus TaxID=34615 RepID=A0AC60PLI4_IXOPE|nr:hypothetical protein HPB47_002316 [Ixodes persulcatus]
MKEAVPKLLLVKKLGGIPVEARVPWTRHHIAGVVRDVDQGLSEEDIYNSMRAPAHILGVRRLGKSTTVRVTFEGKDLPQYVHMGYKPAFRGSGHYLGDTSQLCTLSAEFVAARVSIGKRTFHVLVGYVRPDGTEWPTDDLLTWCKNIDGDLLLCGALNAHSEAWDSRKMDKRTDAVTKLLEELDLVVASDGGPTVFRPPSTYSAIDVTAHAPTLELAWATAPDTRGSDHFPIHITVKGCQMVRKVVRPCTNWDVFRAALDTSRAYIATAIVQALQEATHTTCISEWLPNPDLTFLNLQAARTRAQRKYRRTKNPEDKTQFNRVPAKLRRHAKALVRARWKLMCRNINAHLSQPKLWRVLGAMTGSCRTRHALQVLALAANITEQLAAERLCALYAPAEAPGKPGTPNLSPGPLDAPFTVQELESALWRCRKKSAAGPDGIPYQALTNLPDDAQEALVAWFNTIWESGDVPDGWKLATAVPILKAGKPPGMTESYRPVSLTSCVSKVFERMVQARLRWYLDAHCLLPECMTGFRRGLSAQDSIFDPSDLEENKNKRRNTVAVFLDVERAYDGVPLSTILRRLTEAGLTGKIQALLANFLTGRKIEVCSGRTVSSPRVLHRGLPQGSVLSQAIFNIVMAQLPCSIPPTPLPVQATITTCRPATNAVRRMTGATWGCTERTILAAQTALVTSRILYRLSYMSPSPTDLERLEQMHRQGLRMTLGILKAAKNTLVLQEHSGLSHTETKSLSLEWSGRFHTTTSSTTAELVAVEKALLEAAKLPPQPMVLLTDSRCAIQKIANAETGDPATAAARKALAILEAHGSSVWFQWIPGHVGIQGNERADNLAAEAHQLPPMVPTPAHPQQAALDVRWHLLQEKPEKSLPKGTLTGLSRAVDTLVRRLRTNTAYRNEFLAKMKQTAELKLSPMQGRRDDPPHPLRLPGIRDPTASAASTG